MRDGGASLSPEADGSEGNRARRLRGGRLANPSRIGEMDFADPRTEVIGVREQAPDRRRVYIAPGQGVIVARRGLAGLAA